MRSGLASSIWCASISGMAHYYNYYQVDYWYTTLATYSTSSSRLVVVVVVVVVLSNNRQQYSTAVATVFSELA